MSPRTFSDDEIPYFSWDRRWTAGEIRKRLQKEHGTAWKRLAAWILREAAFADVWYFLKPADVWSRFSDLEPLLGRKRRFWAYILRTWRELGKI